jgi:hypothetical protein
MCLSLGALFGLGHAVLDVHPSDAGTYWEAGHSAHYYGAIWSAQDAYVYPPPLAQIAGALPWEAFILLWMTLVGASFWYCARWTAVPVIAIAVVQLLLFGPGLLASPVALAVVGNAQVVVLACVVVGTRHGSAWAPAILTKIAPAIGWLWLLVRRERRTLAIAAGVTGVAAVVSIALAPAAWADYAGFVASNWAAQNYVPTIGVPLWIRVPTATILLVWGARTDRVWTVPLAVGWSALTVYEAGLTTAMMATVPLVAATDFARRGWRTVLGHQRLDDAPADADSGR